MPGLRWSGWRIGARLEQLGPIRLIHIQEVTISVTVRLIHLGHNLAIFDPLNSATTDLNVQLEEVSALEHTSLQVIRRETCCSQTYVLGNHWLEADLRENRNKGHRRT